MIAPSSPTLDELIESLRLEMLRNPSPMAAKFQLVCETIRRELDIKVDKETN